MNRSVVGLVCLLFAGLLTQTAAAQCQGGGGRGGGGSPGGSNMMGASMGSGMGMSNATMFTGPGSWAYDQMLGQARARQLAQQAYQKQLEDQARRAESLAKRQYFAAQRREQKLKSPAAANTAKTLLAANSSQFSPSQSLDFFGK